MLLCPPNKTLKREQIIPTLLLLLLLLLLPAVLSEGHRITREVMLAALQRLAGGGESESGNDIQVVSAFDVPLVQYDPVQKKMYVDSSPRWVWWITKVACMKDSFGLGLRRYSGCSGQPSWASLTPAGRGAVGRCNRPHKAQAPRQPGQSAALEVGARFLNIRTMSHSNTCANIVMSPQSLFSNVRYALARQGGCTSHIWLTPCCAFPLW